MSSPSPPSPTDRPPARPGPFVHKPSPEELVPLAQAAMLSDDNQETLDWMLAGLDAKKDASAVAEVKLMPLGHARMWRNFDRRPATFATWWPAHLVGVLKKGHAVFRDFGQATIPSPVSSRASCWPGTMSIGLWANYHPPPSEAKGYTHSENGRSTCHTNVVHERAAETTTGQPAPLDSLYHCFGDYFPAAHTTSILIDGKSVPFDPHIHAYGTLSAKQQEEHNGLTVTMYSGMFIDEGRRGRVGMHAIVMGYNAHHYLWPLLQKAASLASEVLGFPYILNRPEVMPLPPPKKKPSNWKPEKWRLKHSSRAVIDMSMEEREQWDEAYAVVHQDYLKGAEVTYFRGLAKKSSMGVFYEEERSALARDGHSRRADPLCKGYDARGVPSSVGPYKGPYMGPSELNPDYDPVQHGSARNAALSWMGSWMGAPTLTPTPTLTR